MQNPFVFVIAIIANMAMAAVVSPLATRGDAPPPVAGGLVWCTNQQDKFCTVGIHDNFDTHEIDLTLVSVRPSVLGNVYASTNQVYQESKYTISWNDGSGNPHFADVLVHDVTGGTDEFWHGGDHYQEGWTFESPLPVYYEFRAFRCEA
ncbi:hypothetical protein DHEL01_v204529 [Diaporthe helianthi]|uniref:BYS1 domain-containing protein n=1 Tax=Diaporthe helianthi TaxID=158607 RepID=A0A2P5I3I9_DIAHE|nr:hypothetical protein DHEL01_v204529 [Diaporthe helianthi]